MNTANIETIAKKKHDKGEGLYSGGYSRVTTVVKGDNFIVYEVVSKNCNRGGSRSSGITQWGGIFAHDGKQEVTIKPLSLWRDGENERNDKPWLQWRIGEVEEDAVTLVNAHDGSRETGKVNFTDNSFMVTNSMSKVEWLEKRLKNSVDRYSLLLNKVAEVLRRLNPMGYNSIGAYVVRGVDVFKIDRHEEFEKTISVEDVKSDENFIFLCKECLYGDPYKHKVFVSRKNEVICVIDECSVASGYLHIDPKESVILYRQFTEYKKGANQYRIIASVPIVN